MFCQSPLLIHFELELAFAGGRVAVGSSGLGFKSEGFLTKHLLVLSNEIILWILKSHNPK